MKALRTAMVLAVIFVSVVAHADVTLNLYVYNTDETSATILPGESVDFWVRMVTGASDSVAQVNYRILLETDDWELTSREMSDYGWFEDDGLWDNSLPTASACPATVTNALYNTTPSDPDFYADTTRGDFAGVTGTWTVEDFQLTIPGDTPLADYTISLLDPEATDAFGNPFDAYAGDDFILSVVPEPATMVLTLSGLAALGVGLKRRRKS